MKILLCSIIAKDVLILSKREKERERERKKERERDKEREIESTHTGLYSWYGISHERNVQIKEAYITCNKI